RCVLAGGVGDRERPDALSRLPLEPRVGALRERGGPERSLRLSDQPAVERDACGRRRLVEERLQVLGEPLAIRRGEVAPVRLPVDEHPGLDALRLEVRPFPEHAVDAQPFEEEVGVVRPVPDLLLDPEDEPREERVAEEPVVALLRGGAELPALVEAEARRPGGPRVAIVPAAGNGSDGVQRGERRRGIDVLRRERGDLLLRGRGLGRHRVDVGAVLPVADEPGEAGEEDDCRRGGVGSALPPRPQPLETAIRAREIRLREGDAPEQVGDEVAPAGTATRTDRLRSEPEAPGDGAEQAIDGRPFLRAARQVDAAEQRRRLVLARTEAASEELLQNVAEERHLPRKAEDERASRGIALLLHARELAVVETR